MTRGWLSRWPGRRCWRPPQWWSCSPFWRRSADSCSTHRTGRGSVVEMATGTGWCSDDAGEKKGWEVQKMQEKVDITKVAFDAFFGDFGYITNKMYIILWMFKFNYGVFLVGLIGYSQQSGDIMGIEWDNLYHWPCGYCISLDDVIGQLYSFIY